MGRNRNDVKNTFEEIFGNEPIVVRAPGRINIIGEHTDYNDGFVLPAAIDLSVFVFIQRSGTSRSKLISVDLDESYSLGMHDALVPVDQGWVNYFLGVIDQFQLAGHKLEGFNLMFTSDIPMGSGLSSSAALECGFGQALSELFKLKVDKVALAKMGQAAEHKFAGVKCGIMDQFASCMGQNNQVVKLDCRSLEYDYYPADFKDYELVLFDSNVKHNLADSQYNIRRNQCEEGVKIIQAVNSKVSSLRDATLEDLAQAQAEMEEVVYHRCKYVIEENIRVQAVCEALKAGDITKVGQIMLETHAGLSREYEVSCKELDTLIEIASACDGHIGGRMMGGGFGGCTVNLIQKDKVDQVIEEVTKGYQEALGINTKVYRVAIADGVGVCKQEINEGV
ncbi:galactokinase [Reichenbachiella faecimaris]|uniref:Galactokinase n=1 Tax=Reichenbachiella faecimaris TaxID=692418 RepID=A0A1W2G8T8_REIFA|nr:galactokinase [Reichenbachiella faecimaris]SMD32914.1 galactokinase [Reichenbachiella faecimaris]